MEDLREYVHYYLLSTALYTFLYYLVAARLLPRFIPHFCNLTPDQNREWISNSASIITSLICGAGTVAGLGMEMDGDIKFKILQVLVTALTGYWVSDTIYRLNYLHVLKNRRFQYFLIFHHCLGIIAVQIAVLHREMMNVKLVFIMMELGSLFINIRFCLLDLNFDRSSNVYEGVSYVMIATFFLTRLLPVPYMYHEAGYRCIWMGDREVCSAACRPFVTFNAILYTVFTALNIYWFYVMLIGLAKHSIRKRFLKLKAKAAASTGINVSDSGNLNSESFCAQQQHNESSNEVTNKEHVNGNDEAASFHSASKQQQLSPQEHKTMSPPPSPHSRQNSLSLKIATQINNVKVGGEMLFDKNEDETADEKAGLMIDSDGLKLRKPSMLE